MIEDQNLTQQAHAPLFESTTAGAIPLPNRILMAPLTRSRSTPEQTQTPLHAEYYSQRASAGLIVTEATQISQEGQGYAWTPGIYAQAHVDAWRPVVDAVHAAGGRIVCQLWHVGAISHGVFQNGAKPVSASPWTPDGMAFVGDLHPEGPVLPHPEARALKLEEISRLLDDYRNAAQCAKDAGFDGVEIHGANGYLIDQFLRSSVNTRTDAYGGSIENRIRLLTEVVDAVCDVWSADRVGVRLSPKGGVGGSYDDDPKPLHVAAATALAARGLAYLHVVRPGREDDIAPADQIMPALRDAFDGTLIVNGGFGAAEAAEWIEKGRADAVAFGQKFLANPDLPTRIAQDGPYTEADASTFYGGGAAGYTDYPRLSE